MAARLIPASVHLQRNYAGMTGGLSGARSSTGGLLPIPADHNAPAPLTATVSEALPRFVHGESGDLHYLFGGPHPENAVPTPVNTELVRATDSIAGKLGGLVPRTLGALQPGPAGPSALRHPVQETRAAANVAANAGRSVLSNVRRILGI